MEMAEILEIGTLVTLGWGARPRTQHHRTAALAERYDDMVDGKKVASLLKLAKSKLGISEKQSEITKERKAAARLREAEKQHAVPKEIKADRNERPRGKSSNRDKLADSSPKNRRGLFGNQGEKAS